jgi:endonuclease/exonuclease/phosphatase family metal-dependent hydrolase
MIRVLFRLILGLVLIVAVLFGGLLVFSTITDYQPKPGSEEDLAIDGDAEKGLPSDTLSILIWNIGYGGLGAEMDFFNDGGKGTRPSKELSEKYLQGILDFIKEQQDSTDFFMLQEVDRNSKRSYEVDQVNEILASSKSYNSIFALNYDVKFVPVPFGIPYTPYGKTNGGLQTLSKYSPVSATRLQYPGGFEWPTKLYMLDRCALELKMKLNSGKELLLVNTHNTAYDASGEIKKIEMEYIKARYESAVKEGKRVILGGDWNQVPPGWDSKHFSAEMPEGYTPQALDNSMIPAGFEVHFDSSLATNRSNDIVYTPGTTYTTLIDYFMTSPNVEVLRVQSLDRSFSFSDHQPVRLTVVIH